MSRVALLETGLQAGDLRRSTYHAIDVALGRATEAADGGDGAPGGNEGEPDLPQADLERVI